jgi:hypothetical protein
MTAKVKIEDKDSVTYKDYDVDKLKFKRCCADNDDEKIDDELKKILD